MTTRSRATCELIADDPTFYKGYTSLGRVYAQQGKFLDAIRMLEKGRSLAGDVPNILGAMGQVYALGGEPDRAREILGQLEQRRQNAWVPSTVFAIVHIGLGEYDRALDWLERGCRLHEVPMTALKVHPVYDPLRAPRRDSRRCCANCAWSWSLALRGLSSQHPPIAASAPSPSSPAPGDAVSSINRA